MLARSPHQGQRAEENAEKGERRNETREASLEAELLLAKIELGGSVRTCFRIAPRKDAAGNEYLMYCFETCERPQEIQ